METIAFANARRRFSEIIDRVKDGNEPIIITRYGKEAAALISVDRFRKEDGFVAGVERWRERYGKNPQQENPFDNIRQKDEGRAFEW